MRFSLATVYAFTVIGTVLGVPIASSEPTATTLSTVAAASATFSPGGDSPFTGIKNFPDFASFPPFPPGFDTGLSKRSADASPGDWGWFWYVPRPGDPAMKKRDALAEANPEANPGDWGWFWYVPRPGDPAMKKRDALAEANPDANPDASSSDWSWFWYKVPVGTSAMKKRDALADANPDANPVE